MSVIITKGKFSANTEVIAFSLIECKKSHPLWANGTWKDHHCRRFLPATSLTKRSITLRAICFGKDKRSHSPIQPCNVTFSKTNTIGRPLEWGLLYHPLCLIYSSHIYFNFIPSPKRFICNRELRNKEIENYLSNFFFKCGIENLLYFGIIENVKYFAKNNIEINLT